MSGSLNKVYLIGHLGRDPEGRSMSSGGRVVTFSLATSESWRDKKTGERITQTEWHDVVIFNENLGKIAEQYLKKGHKAYVVGAQKTRTYTDRDKIERRRTEVVLTQFGGELVLLEKAERPAPSPDSYGKTSTRLTEDQQDDPRLRMASRQPSTAEMIDDDIPL